MYVYSTYKYTLSKVIRLKNEHKSLHSHLFIYCLFQNKNIYVLIKISNVRLRSALASQVPK